MSNCNHRPAILAQNTIGQVSICQCGTAQVTLGPVTIRVAAEQLETVSNLLASAVRAASLTDEVQTASDGAESLHN
ncbi:MAG: hypothetical protein AAFQ82_22825 [Myxococcota bacterium]